MLLGGLLIMAGYFLCYFFNVKKDDETITEVRRIKPNLKNPLQPYTVHYEKYKSDGLYTPQSPKRGDSA